MLTNGSDPLQNGFWIGKKKKQGQKITRLKYAKYPCFKSRLRNRSSQNRAFINESKNRRRPSRPGIFCGNHPAFLLPKRLLEIGQTHPKMRFEFL